MEKKDYCSVGDVLRQALEETEMQGHLDELRAASLWPSIIGSHVAGQCLKPYVKNGEMSIRVPNASLRQELNMNRRLLIAEFNRLMGREVIKGLQFR